MIAHNADASQIEDLLNAGYVIETVVDFSVCEHGYIVFVQGEYRGCLAPPTASNED